MVETRTKIYIKYEEEVEKLHDDDDYKKLLNKDPEKFTKKDWEKWNLYENKEESLFSTVIEESYKELYDLFEKVTGYSLDLLNKTWDDFKEMVDENLGYDEEVYDLYFPDMLHHFSEIGEIWFEQTNH